MSRLPWLWESGGAELLDCYYMEADRRVITMLTYSRDLRVLHSYSFAWWRVNNLLSTSIACKLSVLYKLILS
ncbi:Uncharacterized protein TCM_023986 [Theobroma cacao]|uniref:Uncharacterized protein n=1 Tax=Theobroma cacao TaxID=3641 RepID=A0A061EVH4_THECC|nr:Uncharacterized protein TCM_023986 [Theobroma cacao]